jgi:nitroreductase
MNQAFVESPVDTMTVGLFVQTFMLALAEKGLASCLQVSVAGYPEVLRKEFGVGEDQFILCGMAIGWPVEHNAVNELEIPRDDLAKQITFLED